MPILELEADAAQLRQVARSYAAGEIDRADYLQIRRAVVDGFAESHGAAVSSGIPNYESAAGGSDATTDVERESWSLMATVGAAAMLLFVVVASFLLA